MKPLYWIAAGLALVVFTKAPPDRYDYSEVLGNAFVLIGWIKLARARPEVPLRLTLWYLVVLAFVLSIVLSAADARAWLEDADAAVIWAASLPALGFQAALCHAMTRQASAGKARGGWWWTVAEVGILIALVATVLYDGADWDWLYGVGTVGLAGVLLVMVLCLVYGPAVWAGGPEPEPEVEDAEAT